MADDVVSPCTNVCVIDQASGLCRGCARTLDEIANWVDYSRAEKLVVLARLAQRKAAVAAADH